jgi:hypothetical protein
MHGTGRALPAGHAPRLSRRGHLTSAGSPSRRCSTAPSRPTSRPSSRGRPGRTEPAGGRPSSAASSRRASGVAGSHTVWCACAVSAAATARSSPSAAVRTGTLSRVRRGERGGSNTTSPLPLPQRGRVSVKDDPGRRASSRAAQASTAATSGSPRSRHRRARRCRRRRRGAPRGPGAEPGRDRVVT